MNSELNKISINILDAQSIDEERLWIKSLANFLEGEFTFSKQNKASDIGGGIALSPVHAQECLHDEIRTARFLKGIFKAINRRTEIEDDSIELLYAGCGPIGTLLTPLLGLLDQTRLKITFLDLHEASIESVKQIMQNLYPEIKTVNYVVSDATSYKHPSTIDILITETMDKGLTREPQVEITHALSPQLKWDGILIPESISIYHEAAQLSACLRSSFDQLDLNKPLFSVSKDSPAGHFKFHSEEIKRQDDLASRPDVCLHTRVCIFEDIFLQPQESLITNTICVGSLFNVSGENYSLSYFSYPEPRWELN